MALISLSDWLDRCGDAAARTPSADELDSLRFTISEASTGPAGHRHKVAAGASWRDRLRRFWQRAFWRLKRLPSGHA